MNLIPRQTLLIGFYSVIAALTWQFLAILRVGQSMDTDSFVTLSFAGQLGLGTVTVVLILILLSINLYVSKKLRQSIVSPIIALPINLICAFFLFVLFWGISPQFFYLYYQLLFDDLPWQWVIRDWLPIKQTLLLLFPGRIHNTSSLAAGIALVILLAQVVLTFKLQPQARAINN